MARSSYNYTLAEQHNQKIYIPYINLEFKGWLSFVTVVIATVTITFVFGTMLSFFLGSSGYMVSFGAAVIIVAVFMSFTNEKNSETGRTKITNFYYTVIKSYRCVYDSKGAKHYIEPKRNGVIYFARR